MSQKIHIYHINDLHSHFESWPQIVQFIEERRKEHDEKNEACFFLDIGDFMDRSHPITEASHGKWNVDLLNEAGVDAITIGNNEGITLSYEQLDTLYEHKKFDVLVANLAYKNGERPKWLTPYKIYQAGNKRIGMIGATIPFTGLYKQLGWEIEDGIQSINRVVNELQDKVDIIIVLSHLGISYDEKLAEVCPQIHIILGAHTHHVLENGKRIGNTLLCGAGKFGLYIGHVTIREQAKKLEIQAKLIPTSICNSNHMSTLEQLQELERRAEIVLEKEVAVIGETLHINWYKETPLIRQLAEGIREWCNGDIGMVNAGVLLHSLEKGPVTKKQIHSMCPHPINPCLIEIEGSLLKEIVKKSQSKKLEELEIKGLGFRGKVMGKMIFDGLEIKKNELYIQNKLVDDKEIYKVATLDMFTFGYIFPELANRKITYFMPELLRDIVKWKLISSNYL